MPTAALGTVQAIDFGTYLQKVLSNEWVSSWTAQSLNVGYL